MRAPTADSAVSADFRRPPTQGGGVSEAGVITFRPIEAADLPMVADWLARDFVQKWWQEPSDLPSVEAKYGPRVGGDGVTRCM